MTGDNGLGPRGPGGSGGRRMNGERFPVHSHEHGCCAEEPDHSSAGWPVHRRHENLVAATDVENAHGDEEPVGGTWQEQCAMTGMQLREASFSCCYRSETGDPAGGAVDVLTLPPVESLPPLAQQSRVRMGLTRPQ